VSAGGPREFSASDASVIHCQEGRGGIDLPLVNVLSNPRPLAPPSARRWLSQGGPPTVAPGAHARFSTEHDGFESVTSIPGTRLSPMVMWATPEWEGEWSGDPAQVLAACEAVEHVLREAGRPLQYTWITLDWERGYREESSIEDARDALRFAEPPQTVTAFFAFGTGESVRVRGRRSEVSGHRVGVTTDVREDFDLAQRLVDAARHAVERDTGPEPPVPTAQGVTQAADGPPEPQHPVEPTATPEPGGGLAWMERHTGLLTAIGVVVAESASRSRCSLRDPDPRLHPRARGPTRPARRDEGVEHRQAGAPAAARLSDAPSLLAVRRSQRLALARGSDRSLGRALTVLALLGIPTGSSRSSAWAGGLPREGSCSSCWWR
jgi:hypothetical protein